MGRQGIRSVKHQQISTKLALIHWSLQGVLACDTILHVSCTPQSGAFLCRLRSSLSYQATQLPTPAPASADKPSHKLAAYLPAILVDAYSEAGIMHDLYPWQVQPSSPPRVWCSEQLAVQCPSL